MTLKINSSNKNISMSQNNMQEVFQATKTKLGELKTQLDNVNVTLVPAGMIIFAIMMVLLSWRLLKYFVFAPYAITIWLFSEPSTSSIGWLFGGIFTPIWAKVLGTVLTIAWLGFLSKMLYDFFRLHFEC